MFKSIVTTSFFLYYTPSVFPIFEKDLNYFKFAEKTLPKFYEYLININIYIYYINFKKNYLKIKSKNFIKLTFSKKYYKLNANIY